MFLSKSFTTKHVFLMCLLIFFVQFNQITNILQLAELRAEQAKVKEAVVRLYY